VEKEIKGVCIESGLYAGIFREPSDINTAQEGNNGMENV
jgi:hypothetical protein